MQGEPCWTDLGGRVVLLDVISVCLCRRHHEDDRRGRRLREGELESGIVRVETERPGRATGAMGASAGDRQVIDGGVVRGGTVTDGVEIGGVVSPGRSRSVS